MRTFDRRTTSSERTSWVHTCFISRNALRDGMKGHSEAPSDHTCLHLPTLFRQGGICNLISWITASVPEVLGAARRHCRRLSLKSCDAGNIHLSTALWDY